MKMYELKLTSAVVLKASVVPAGTRVEVDEATAKDWLRRGKAELVASRAERVEPAEQDDKLGLSKLSHAELVEAAEALEIAGADKLSKAELIKAIEAANA